MAVNVKVESKQLVKAVEKLTKQVTDMTPAFRSIADLELSQTKLRFIDEKDPQGNKWEVPFTIRRGTGPETGSGRFATTTGWDYVKASNYHATPPNYRFFDPAKGDKILRDTGMLLKSIGRAFGPSFAVVGTNRSYAEDVQNGEGNRKARPFIGLNQKSVDNVRTVMNAYIKGILK